MRVAVVDPQPARRAGIRTFVEAEPDLRWAGEAASTAELRLLLPVDVVLAAIEVDGPALARTVRELAPATGVAFLVPVATRRLVADCIGAGARGLLLDTARADEFVRAARAVGGGDAWFSAAAGERLAELFGPALSPLAARFPTLTARELQVLEGLARGSSNGEVALALGLSPKTVRNHVSSICTKLRVVDRAQAVLRAHGAYTGHSSRVSRGLDGV